MEVFNYHKLKLKDY